MSQACGCRCEHGTSVAPRDPITPEDTIETTARRFPRAPEILRGLGIDTCCGGRLTLAQAAASAGLPVEGVLRALDAAAKTT